MKLINMKCLFHKKLTIHVTHNECDAMSCYGCKYLIDQYSNHVEQEEEHDSEPWNPFED